MGGGWGGGGAGGGKTARARLVVSELTAQLVVAMTNGILVARGEMVFDRRIGIAI